MYELVNTSVPNGLVAGTHGFATVAMTKGMPDAIRTRVENFCAYPHRTSAHDATYFQENPINWFHLTLPTGDHVIGRTAPSDFDYTGRTNRLSHVLVLSEGDIPAAGTVSALNLESARLTESWSGDPRYLPVDKELPRKFFALSRTRSSTPTNWVSLLGADGASLAKRFARLLEQNVRQGGKSIYFKASTNWDNSGKKLLGLFSDLLDLLPESLTSQVTFSTFAPCVPSGAVCHLRGVFDKDRAFEVASATQPWVDCENGRVEHAEMLPEESATVAPSQRETPAANGDSHKAVQRPNLSRAAQLARAGSVRPNGSTDKAGLSVTMAAIALVVIALVGVIAGVLFWFDQKEKERRRDDEMLRIAREENARKDAAAAEEAERKARERREAEERRKLGSTEESVKTNGTQMADAQESEACARRKLEEMKAQERNKQKEIARKKAEQEKEAERIDQEKKKRLDLADWSKLKITRVLAPGVGIDDSENGIGDAVKKSLTNELSIVVWRPEGDKVVHEFCYFLHSTKSVTKTGGRRGTEDVYTLKVSDALKSAPWCVLTYTKEGGQREVLWKWNRNSETCRLPEDGKGGVDLGDVVFGKAKTARELWKRSYPGAVFVARLTSAFTDKNGRPMYALVLKMEDPSLTVSAFAGLKETLRKKKTDLESKIKELENFSCGVGKWRDEDPQEQLEAIRAAIKSVSSLHEQWKQCKRKAKNDDRAKEDAARINEQIREIAEKWAVKKGDKYKGPNEVTTYLNTMGIKAKNLECKVAERDQELRKLKRDLEKLEEGFKGIDEKIKNSSLEVSVVERCPESWTFGLNDLEKIENGSRNQ